MQRFTALPIFATSYDGHNFTIARRIGYKTLAGVSHWVEIGILTDGGSMPQLIWDVLPPFGLYWPALVLHDYLYRNADGKSGGLTRDYCDNVALEAMEDLGVGLITRTTIFDGIRIGGSWAFESDRKIKIAAEQAVHKQLLVEMVFRDSLKAVL